MIFVDRLPVRREPVGRDVIVLAAAVIASALALMSRQPTLAEDRPSNQPVVYLEKLATTDATPYHARQLVVYMGQPQSAAVLDIRSTPQSTFVRADGGDNTMRLWRHASGGIVSGNTGTITDDGPAAVPVNAADIVTKYDVSVGPAQKILGVDVVPLTLVRKSDQMMVERMWVHPPSGVVYRRELYGPNGKLVGLSTIIDMRWGEHADAERYEVPSIRPSRAWATLAHDAPDRLPFGYTLAGTYAIDMRGHRSVQWVYTDGLHALSVFRAPGGLRVPRGFVRADVRGVRAWTGPGPGTWVWEGAGSSWVIVAEEPDLDAAQLLAPFPHASPSAWARMGRLWSKAGRGIARLF
jgi:hypothetical protein